MPLPDALAGPRWRETIARVIFPWLLWIAKNHRTIYYSDLDNEIVRRRVHHHVNFVQYGHPAGAVGNALLEIGNAFGEEIPPLNALVVAKSGVDADMPSEGCDWYLNKFLHRKINFKKLSVQDKRAVVDEVHDAIFSYRRWDEVQRYFEDVASDFPELAPFDGKFLTIRSQTPRQTRSSSKRAIPWDFSPPPNIREPTEPESQQHRDLKQYVANYPERFGLPKRTKSVVEKIFGSGDRADVCFFVDDRIVVAEVKSEISDVNDLCRGVFQCVKYRALVRAHQKLKHVIPNGEAFLVIGGAMPTEVARVANSLSIRWFDEVVPVASPQQGRAQRTKIRVGARIA